MGAPTASERLDRTGILASTLCAIHCLGASALAAAAPTLRIVESPALEWAFVLVALAIAGVALLRGAREHRARAPLVLFAVAVALILAARLVEWPEERAEVALSVAGAVTLVTAHALNIRLLRRCCAACDPMPAAPGA